MFLSLVCSFTGMSERSKARSKRIQVLKFEMESSAPPAWVWKTKSYGRTTSTGSNRNRLPMSIRARLSFALSPTREWGHPMVQLLQTKSRQPWPKASLWWGDLTYLSNLSVSKQLLPATLRCQDHVNHPLVGTAPICGGMDSGL